MGLVVRVEDENGLQIGSDVTDDHRHFERLLPDDTDTGFRCLCYIDPYGDTVFNVRQMPPLRTELAEIRKSAHADAGRLIDSIDALARQVQETSAHLYLKFYGD